MLWFSATKPLTAVCVLQLAERGVVDLDRPIADAWQEFAQGGKGSVTARHVLTHRGGFPVFPRDFDWTRIGDWKAVTAATAALEAEWVPGTEVGYHPVTYGFALGELIRRVDGRTPRDFMREELFVPLGMEASLGVDPEQLGDVVRVEAKSEVTFEDPEGSECRTTEMAQRFNRPATLQAQIPAATGIGTAEALARFYAMLERGGVLDGVSLLQPESVREATRVHAKTVADRTSGLPSSYGLGFCVGGVWEPYRTPGVFGHGGQQCVISYADPSRGLAVAYVTNGLQDPATFASRISEVAAAAETACGA
jgi:CubicO group peptidase (beta-lactamase class C family)